MSRTRKRLLFGGAGAFVVIIAVVAFSSVNRAGADFDPTRLATVERGTMVKSVVATGKIEPIAQVEIKSKANGIIEKLYVDVGDEVKPGDLLADLDKENLRARVREARANLQAAEAGLEAARAQLQKNVIEAEGPDVEFARRAYDRALKLADQTLIAQSALDEAKSAREQAENRQRAAQSVLVISRARVAEAAAHVAQARAAAERAEEELANATIRAPIEATVLTRGVEVGSPVSSILNMGAAATLVMTLGNIEQVFVRGKVDETDVGRIQVGQAARIRVESFRDNVYEGVVSRISPIGAERDNVTTFEVVVSIRNPAHELKANMTANAEIVLEEHANSLIIPESAITYDAQRNAFVDVPAASEPTRRRRVPVELGVGNGIKTQVLEGLNEGDRVILPG
jgi:HlyD family secretion protein